MLVECPGCFKKFRAHIEKGHLMISYKDIHEQNQTVHSNTCKCQKKTLVQEVKKDGTGI